MKIKLSIILILIFIEVRAQEPLSANIAAEGYIPHGFYKAGIRYGNERGDSLHIRWSRTPEADTFWVYKANSNLEYITNAGTRTVWYNQPFRYERRMATHHLREYLLNSPLKFETLEDLAKNRNPQFSGKKLSDYFNK